MWNVEPDSGVEIGFPFFYSLSGQTVYQVDADIR